MRGASFPGEVVVYLQKNKMGEDRGVKNVTIKL
jgi:hypothetical protein